MLAHQAIDSTTRLLKLVQSERVHALANYWQGKLAGRAMPARADMDPSEIRALLPFVALADVSSGPLEVRFRLGGEAICDSYRCNVAGRSLAELDPPGGVAMWLAAFDRVIGTAEPVVGQLRATFSGGDRFVEWAMLPLSNDGRTVNQILQIEDWHALHRVPRNERYAVPWRVEVFD
ncbi:MAG: PAS domain-containing protein [Dongiaceae bacterium]